MTAPAAGAVTKAANREGAICRTCYDKALQIRGCCPVCSADRLLPGRRTDGVAICRDCAGITRDFYCNRCGAEGHLHTGRLCMMLLYAQPASRIVRLTIDDIIHDTDQILLRLGEPPMPLPGPLASLILELAANRQNMNTAANPTCRWLFPGKRAGQPLHPKTLLALIHDLGGPAAATRTAALRQLVIQAPAPVVADAIGYHNKHVTKVLADAGGTWKTYAPGDHSR